MLRELENLLSQCQYVKNVLLPIGLEEIGESAFDNCWNLEKIEIPDSVKKIGANCFERCQAMLLHIAIIFQR